MRLRSCRSGAVTRKTSLFAVTSGVIRRSDGSSAAMKQGTVPIPTPWAMASSAPRTVSQRMTTVPVLACSLEPARSEGGLYLVLVCDEVVTGEVAQRPELPLARYVVLTREERPTDLAHMARHERGLRRPEHAQSDVRLLPQEVEWFRRREQFDAQLGIALPELP